MPILQDLDDDGVHCAGIAKIGETGCTSSFVFRDRTISLKLVGSVAEQLELEHMTGNYITRV